MTEIVKNREQRRANTSWRIGALILRAMRPHRVSKDGPTGRRRAFWSVLRDATLRAAPQEEVAEKLKRRAPSPLRPAQQKRRLAPPFSDRS
jgi:hypothetical protein